MDSAVEELLLAALEQPAKKTLDSLGAKLAAAGTLDADTQSALNMMWEKWGAEELDEAQAEFCVAAARLGLPENPLLRKLLPNAAKLVLPPYFGRNPVIKALGARDENVPAQEFARRLGLLRQYKSGLIIFLTGSSRWGVAGPIDNINATVSIAPFGAAGMASATPLEIVLRDGILLQNGPELLKLLDPRRQTSAGEFRRAIARRQLLPIGEETLKQMAKAGCAKLMEPAAFEQYWSAGSAAGSAVGTPAGAGRRSCDGRSVKEMDLLLTDEEKSARPFSDDEVAGFLRFFTNLKAETAAREVKPLAAIVGRINPRATAEQQVRMFAPLIGKAPFWPADPKRCQLESLSVWGEAAAKTLDGLAAATATALDSDYLATLAMHLPLKALNSVLAKVSDEQLQQVCCDNKASGADLLLWIWKNRKKRVGRTLSLLNVDNVVHALSNENLPKAWGAAMREMRAMLLDDAPFQGQLLKAANGDAMAFAATLQSALFLSQGERQSLMVKLARLSDELRDYLETGAGQRILKAGIGKTQTVSVPAENEPHYTSIASHQRLLAELDDIINVQQPENREALKTARAHGDFRENSEFDAAKDRRNFLTRRRNELEKELAVIQPLAMASVHPEKEAVVGSEIELVYADGEKETYQLLGAWDGNPDRKFLSYRTRLGQAVLHRQTGDDFEAPGGRKCRLAAVRPLAAALIKELDQQ